MRNQDNESAQAEGVAPRSHRLVRRLTWLFAIESAAVAVFLCAALLPSSVLPQARAIAQEAISGGLSALVLTSLLLPLTVLLGTLALTWARFRFAEGAATARRVWDDPGFAARPCQALIVPVGTLLIWLVVKFAWPAMGQPAIGQSGMGAEAPLGEAAGALAGAATHANLAAAFVFALAFVSLVTERVMNVFPAPQLPEAPALRRVLLLTTLLLVAGALVELGRGAGLAWVRWPLVVLICVPGAVASELSLRALARMFIPAPAPAEATAVTESLIASLITGGPRAPGNLLRTHLGLDFARSWALKFLSAAILPAILGTALFCWILTGLKLIDLGQRGIYERFGAPVAVLGPGLHLLLPWPLGRLRPVEYGTIHSVAIGVDPNAPQEKEQSVAAEATPPASLNRLWESSHPGQANYLVPSRGTGQEGFQSVSTEISVLYRVGLSDEAARESVYTVADPESLIRESASRLVLRYFNSRELDSVLRERRDQTGAASLRAALAANMEEHHTGIEIVSVLIEEIHPPAGAAGAYHAVQAAVINSKASIAQETGRAKRAAGVAQQEAHQLLAAADAQAAETIAAADADAYRFNADRRAYGEAGQSFVLERTYSKLKTALAQTPLTIVDHRLSPSQGPVLDLRNPGAGRAAPAAPPATAPAAPAASTARPAAAPTGTPDIDLPD